MGKFNLARDWFGPEAVFYREKHNPHEFPDSMLAVLPSKTVFVDGPNAGKTVGVVRGDKAPAHGEAESRAQVAALQKQVETLMAELTAAKDQLAAKAAEEKDEDKSEEKKPESDDKKSEAPKAAEPKK